MNLRTKLILTHTVVALIAAVLVALIASVTVNRYFVQLANAQARAEAELYAEPLAYCYALNNGWPNRLNECLRPGRGIRPALAPDSNRRTVVADASGTIIFDPGGHREGKKLPANALNRGTLIKVGDQVVGSVIVEPNTGQYGAAEDQFIKLVRRSVLLGSIGTAVLASLIAAMLSLRVTRSLRTLTGAAYRLAQGDRSARVPVHNNDEVGELSHAFNTMSDALERSESVRRQMVADIAHELRTPLSVLQLELESLEDGVTQPTPEVIRSLGEEVELLKHLITDLRTLSLADAGQLPLNMSAVDIQPQVDRLLARMQGPARDKNITLTAQVAADLPPIYADAARLQQVIGNLLQNAIRYTPAGGSVMLEIKQRQQQVVWVVRDSGPGFDPAEAQAIFERFYRSDRARARHTGGSGLGLAIVRSLTQAMQGQVWAESQPGQGATFTVALPIAATV